MSASLYAYLTRSNLCRVSIFIAGLLLCIAVGRWLHTITQPLTANNAGWLMLQDGRPDDAMYLFDRDDWRGVAYYRAGRYSRAIRIFAEENTVESIYNMGNAYAKLGRFDQSVQIYERILQEVPEHEDARYNLELVRRAARLSQQTQPGDSSESGAPEDDSAAQNEPADESMSRDDDVVQTIKTDPPQPVPQQGDGNQQLTDDSDPLSTEQTQPGDGGGETDQDDTPEEGSALATSMPEESSSDELPENTPLMSGKLPEAELDEGLAEEILLRHIRDDAKVVLRARLRMALKLQEAGDR